MSLHSGEIVELAVRRKGICISELSRRMHVNRRSIYNWFQQKNLPPPNIRKIGLVIRHDFSKEFPEYFVPADFAISEQSDLFINNNCCNGADRINNWQKKYQTLLNDFNSYLRSIEFNELADEGADKPRDDFK